MPYTLAKKGKDKHYAAVALRNRARYDESISGEFKELNKLCVRKEFSYANFKMCFFFLGSWHGVW